MLGTVLSRALYDVYGLRDFRGVTVHLTGEVLKLSATIAQYI